MLIGDHTPPVGVGEHQVVIIGDEAWRGLGIPGGQRSVRKVELLVTLLHGRCATRLDLLYRLFSCVLPDHVWMSLTVAGPNAARYLNTLGLKAGQAPYGVEAGESLPL